jgi:hypothetical protein
LHLSYSGKEKIAELIGEHTKNHTKKKEEDLITLKWKENWKKPIQEETKRKLITDKEQEPNLIEVTSSRHYPTTRNEDFYGWGFSH